MINNLERILKNGPHKKFMEAMQGEMLILKYLYSCEGLMLPNEISDKMSITSARTAVALNSLEKKGFINREINKQDRRQILVTLTNEGKEYIKELLLEEQQRFARVLEGLGEKDAKEFVRIIEKIVNNFNNTE